MKDCIETSVAIANELAENLSKIDRDAVEKLMEAILGANRIFSAACWMRVSSTNLHLAMNILRVTAMLP